MKIIIILAVLLYLILSTAVLFRRVGRLRSEEHGDYAELRRIVKELRRTCSGLEERFEALNEKQEALNEKQEAAVKQAELYTQGINNILGYGGRMGAE